MHASELIDDTATGGVADYYADIVPKPIERHPGDTEIALQTMIVRLPDEPMVINGSPFNFHVNYARLGQAINYVRKRGARKGYQEPRFLKIILGESLPSKLTDSALPINPPIHDYQNYGFNIVLPKEIVKSTQPTKDLVKQVEAVASQDLATGIRENLYLKSSWATRRLGTQAILATLMAAGEGVGIATSHHTLEMLEKGAGYAATGAILTGLAVATKNIYRSRTYDSLLAPVAQKAYKVARKNKTTDVYQSELKKYFEEPIISLVPASESRASS